MSCSAGDAACRTLSTPSGRESMCVPITNYDSEELQQAYDKLLPTLSYLFTRLARDWQEIDPADKGGIAKLRDCESFPQWAFPLKQKYIDDERASKEAAKIAFQVIKDRMEQKQSTG
jgi:hypothetical protein